MGRRVDVLSGWWVDGLTGHLVAGKKENTNKPISVEYFSLDRPEITKALMVDLW